MGKRIQKGNGSIFQFPNSRFWWMKYYRGGKCYRKSTGKTTKTEAGIVLQNELAQVRTGQRDPSTDKVKVADLFEGLFRDYRINGKASLPDLEARWEQHLKPCFAHLRASDVTTTDVQKYIEARLEEDAANASINRELAALKRAFNLGLRSTPPKVMRVPYVPKLAEDNIRTGFLEPEQYQKLAAAFGKVGLWMRSLFECGYTFGWRISELTSLRVKQVDLAERLVRLDPGTTKNKKGRSAKMTESVYQLLVQCCVGKSANDFVFTRGDGKPVKDFRGAWETGCTEAAVPDLLFHDLRRTAVRNMVRAGIPEHTAMKISGHKTRSVFDRYDIVNEADLARAAGKVEDFQREAAQKSEFGQSIGRSPLKGAHDVLPN